jgi:hypothetical protein
VVTKPRTALATGVPAAKPQTWRLFSRARTRSIKRAIRASYEMALSTEYSTTEVVALTSLALATVRPTRGALGRSMHEFGDSGQALSENATKSFYQCRWRGAQGLLNLMAFSWLQPPHFRHNRDPRRASVLSSSARHRTARNGARREPLTATS